MADDCREWPGSIDGKGYGRFRTRNRASFGAHRLIWELVNGPIPEGMHVLHSCDNPPCCNPAHLSLGSHRDNMADKMAKGRARGPGNPLPSRASGPGWYEARGLSYPGPKPERRVLKPHKWVTPEMLDAIVKGLAEGRLGADLAREHGVGASTISRIAHGKFSMHPSFRRED